MARRNIMTPVKAWMQVATRGRQEQLAKRAGTTRAYLYHLAGGFRAASPELAMAIERVSAEMHRESRGRLPRLYRTDMAPVCRSCDFAQRCLGPIAVRSEFDYVRDDAGEEASISAEG
jgi:hypothetical protein